MTPQSVQVPDKVAVEKVERVVVRLAGDSGDGIQLSGNQLSTSSALAGNDLSTLPDFPAEIRAPAGTLAGGARFQLSFSSHLGYTPGGPPELFVAVNPAARRTNPAGPRARGMVIVHTGALTPHEPA